MKFPKRTLTIITILCVLINAVTPVYAINSYVQDEITTACIELKKIISKQKEAAIDDLKDQIIENDWNYTLTMDSIEEEEAYKNGEYLEILAAYMSVKKYGRDNNKTITPIKDVPLFHADVEADILEECVPEDIPYYKYNEEKDAYELTDKTITIITDEDVATYTKRDDGLYDKTGIKSMVLKKKTTKYGKVIFHLMTAEELLQFYGISDYIEEDYKFRLSALENDSTDSIIYQTLFAKTPDFKEFADFDMDNYEGISDQRKRIIEIAKSLIGKVPYLWGGKPSKPGYDALWWTYNENNEQRGLDCSGYVKWAYMTAGYGNDLCSKLHSTYSMLQSDLVQIPKDYLQPGDIGVKIGSKTNHTGIYIGKVAGKDMWIHCSSSRNGVYVTEFDFQVFYDAIDYYDMPAIPQERITEIAKLTHNGEELIKTTTDSIVRIGSNGEIVRSYDINPIMMGEDGEVEGFYGERAHILDLDGEYYDDTMVYNAESGNLDFSENDIRQVAQLVMSEAGGEGINGQIAVAEVVRNRLKSPLFPNTVEEVIYQPKQFELVERIVRYEPTTEILNITRAALNGQISILNNEDCMYYRNPQKTSNIPATQKVDWGKYKYYTAIGHHAFYLQN